MVFNRKERLQIAKKINQKGGKRPSNKNLNWRMINSERRKHREQQILEELEERNKIGRNNHNTEERNCENQQAGNQNTWYSLCVALPGSILNNVQCLELKTYITGELARSFAIFCVDEVVVFDDTSRLRSNQVDSYYNGDWTGEEEMNERNCECNLYMARILEFLECPQYLRKALFSFQKPLQFSAMLNPLNAMHHLRSNDLNLPYREGVILDKPSNKGLLCDVGLERELICQTSDAIPPYTRVTVRIESDLRQQTCKRIRGSLTNGQRIREEAGIHWGYSVRIAKCLSEVFSSGSYDLIIGTSEKGKPITELSLPPKTDRTCKILVVFGGLNGLEAAVQSDQSIHETDPADVFPNYVNCLPNQGSRVIRTEEAIPICLTALKCMLDKSC